MEDKIKLRAEEFDRYDKKEIALAIRNSTLDDDMDCSLLNKNIIKMLVDRIEGQHQIYFDTVPLNLWLFNMCEVEKTILLI